jgi:hypothetical protein
MSESPTPVGEPSLARSPVDLFLAKVRAAQQLTPEQRILAGSEHSELAIRVVRDGIRDQHPEADAATVERLLRERIELMRRLEGRSGAAPSGVAR